jgi:hypothetical protein
MSDEIQVETRLMAIDEELAVLRREFENLREEVRALAATVREGREA